MITPKRPKIKVPGDDSKKTMHRNGYILAFSKNRDKILWTFGFVNGSPQAAAFKLYVPKNQVFVLAKSNGEILKTAPKLHDLIN